MADILSQEEVDALLAAVSEEEKVEQDEQPRPFHFATYDSNPPKSLSQEHLHGFQTLSELFARELSATLGSSLRAITRVSVASVSEMTYDEYVLSIPNPTSINIIQLPPLEGNLILEFNPSLIFPIIERLLGGSGLAIPKPRELTEIEEKLVAKIIDLVLSALVRAWRLQANLSWKLIAQENDPKIVQMVTGSEIVLVPKFLFAVGDNTGTMSLCLPMPAIEPLLEKAGAEQTYYAMKPGAIETRATAAIKEHISRANVKVEAFFSGSSISVHDLLTLQVGDVIRLKNCASNESCVTICVGGKPKFRAKEKKSGNRQSFQIMAGLR